MDGKSMTSERKIRMLGEKSMYLIRIKTKALLKHIGAWKSRPLPLDDPLENIKDCMVLTGNFAIQHTVICGVSCPYDTSKVKYPL